MVWRFKNSFKYLCSDIFCNKCIFIFADSYIKQIVLKIIIFDLNFNINYL